MAWERRWPVLAALAALASVAAVACTGSASTGSPAASTPVASLSQFDEGQGGVTVEAVWVTAEHLAELGASVPTEFSAGDYVLVHLKLDTHSVNLVGYDLPSLAVLENGTGRSIPAAEWVSIKEDSHHREGLLIFSGKSNQEWVAEEGTAQIRLKDVAGVPERRFRWQF